MDFALDEQQQMVQEMVRSFAEEKIRPGAAERDRTHEFPHEIFAEMGELGLLGMMVPEEYGGAGMDLLSYLIAVEELARVDAAVAVGMTVTNSVCCWPIMSFGSEAQRAEFLPQLASGEAIGGFMLTEPNAGSDAASLTTRYREDGDHWRLDGAKAWITNGEVGRFFICLATSDPALGTRGISTFVLDADQDGVIFDTPEEKMGLRSSRTCMVTLDNARVPKNAMLGEEGRGFSIALATLDHSRLGIAAQSVGIATAALEESLRYSRDRRQFGKAIMDHQAIAFALADMDVEIEAARSLLYRAVWAAGQPGRHSRESASAKLFASEMCNRVVSRAIQIHGGYGFSSEYPVERLFRDARVVTIYEGTSEVQRLVIARALAERAMAL
ncbi:MAG: acyl-CoA dehydrogenase family protein [Thermoanaerobaculales bacterium]|jgi:alkylation response protein AidB-like acyl-CoA dehydrogenase|nr:acyl-CoA dehydrogenase family protein [Thermoanaerobaculales bacterium]